MGIIFVLLKVPDQETAKISTKAKLAQLDFYGIVFLIPGIVCLLLALQWSGLRYSVSLYLIMMAWINTLKHRS